MTPFSLFLRSTTAVTAMAGQAWIGAVNNWAIVLPEFGLAHEADMNRAYKNSCKPRRSPQDEDGTKTP